MLEVQLAEEALGAGEECEAGREAQAVKLPDKKYEIIYADPPWSYNDKNSNGKRGAYYKYSVMSIEAIKSMPIHLITAENCALFLWTTMPMLPEAFKVIEAWGFGYKTVAFVWMKMNKGSDTDFFGLGHWTRSNAELCLLAVKGKPKRISARVRQIVHARVMRHSEKPSEVRERIVELLGDISRIELFARANVEGWDAWGNEVNHV